MIKLEDLDFQDIMLIHYVTKFKHLTLAGEKMYMSQPAVSHRLKVIEDKLGFKIFDKFGNKFIPTKAGEVLNEFYYAFLYIPTHIHNLNFHISFVQDQYSVKHSFVFFYKKFF